VATCVVDSFLSSMSTCVVIFLQYSQHSQHSQHSQRSQHPQHPQQQQHPQHSYHALAALSLHRSSIRFRVLAKFLVGEPSVVSVL
jgi:hypothetical protein